ncbi:MAG: hypothetical protein HQ464_11355 [Planctomycetes bacterium]|nr:hypothetical protein [Planctomycetota bacterium]
MGFSSHGLFSRSLIAAVRGPGRSSCGVAPRRRPLAAERLEPRLPLAVTTPFTVRYQTNDTGDITFAANTLTTAPASDPDLAGPPRPVLRLLRQGRHEPTHAGM